MRGATFSRGIAQSGVPEALFNVPGTAQILGGAVIAADPTHGVIDAHGQVFGYQNLLITDGSALPANPGVNPSLTITALAEHTIAHVPAAHTPEPRIAIKTQINSNLEGQQRVIARFAFLAVGRGRLMIGAVRGSGSGGGLSRRRAGPGGGRAACPACD